MTSNTATINFTISSNQLSAINSAGQYIGLMFNVGYLVESDCVVVDTDQGAQSATSNVIAYAILPAENITIAVSYEFYFFYSENTDIEPTDIIVTADTSGKILPNEVYVFDGGSFTQAGAESNGYYILTNTSCALGAFGLLLTISDDGGSNYMVPINTINVLQGETGYFLPTYYFSAVLTTVTQNGTLVFPVDCPFLALSGSSTDLYLDDNNEFQQS